MEFNIMRSFRLGYSHNNFSKFCIRTEKFEAPELNLVTELPPIETILSTIDPENDRKYVYKALKIFIVARVERYVYGSENQVEYCEKAIHGFVDGSDFHNVIGETITTIPFDNRRIGLQESAETYEEVRVHETKDDELKRLWLGNQSYHVSSFDEDGGFVHVMVETKNSGVYQGTVEVGAIVEFLNQLLIPD